MIESFSRASSTIEHLEAAVGALRAAGVALYLAEDMDGLTYADNELRGDDDPSSPVSQPWSVRRTSAGTWTMRIAVRGGEHGLYEPGPSEHDQLIVRYPAVSRFAASHLEPILRSAGMDVRSVEMAGYDSGWGTQDVHFEVRYVPSD